MRKLRAPHLLRIAASSLAAMGLLGHGLAMLLASLVLTSPVGGSADPADFAAICSSGKIAPDHAALDSQSDSRGKPRKNGSQKTDSCSVCNVFSQAGLAALAPAVPLLSTPPRATEPALLQTDFTPQPSWRGARCRAPPQQA